MCRVEAANEGCPKVVYMLQVTVNEALAVSRT
jgi:hypothetical protein